MRVLLLLAWTAVGALFYAWHAGPGQEQLALDESGRHAEEAAAHAASGRWANRADID